MVSAKIPDDQTLSDFKKFLKYSPETGILTWNPRDSGCFKNKKTAGMWNSHCANMPAGNLGPKGYIFVKVHNERYMAHRICWFLLRGFWPKDSEYIDHINGNRSDNRACNLRIVEPSGNAKNRKIPSNNTSGTIGVSWYKPLSKWCAKIKYNGKKLHLGYFLCIDDAIFARKNAEIELGFHKNHGKR